MLRYGWGWSFIVPGAFIAVSGAHLLWCRLPSCAVRLASSFGWARSGCLVCRRRPTYQWLARREVACAVVRDGLQPGHLLGPVGGALASHNSNVKHSHRLSWGLPPPSYAAGLIIFAFLVVEPQDIGFLPQSGSVLGSVVSTCVLFRGMSVAACLPSCFALVVRWAACAPPTCTPRGGLQEGSQPRMPQPANCPSTPLVSRLPCPCRRRAASR